MRQLKQPFKPKPTGAVHNIEGVKFHAWHVGILRYERRTADGRLLTRDNGSHRSTYSAWVDGECIGNRFLTDRSAAKAAVKFMKRKDKAQGRVRQ